VQGQFVAPELKELFKLPLVDGILIEVVEPGSPAQKAKLNGGELEVTLGGHEFLLGGDIITAIDDATISTPEEFAKALESLKVGSNVPPDPVPQRQDPSGDLYASRAAGAARRLPRRRFPCDSGSSATRIEDSLVRILIRRSRLVVQGPSQ
jgi:hypothetical protein